MTPTDAPCSPTALRIGLVACAALALPACSRQPEQPSPTPAAPAQEPGARRTPTLDELFNSPPEEKDTTPVPGTDWPELPFRSANQGLTAGGTWREEPLIHPFTADGRGSIVASNREEDGLNVWEFQADGSWKLRIEGLRRDLMYGGSTGADFDGDGHDDLLFASHKTGLVLYLNDGAMAWKPGLEIDSPMLMIDVATGDLNGDGQPDAVGIGQFNGGIEVYLGDGAGRLTHRPESHGLERIGFGITIALADIDGDGLDDILASAKVGASVLLTRIDADGRLSWVDASEGLPVPREGNTMRSVVAADVLGDGRLEVICCRLGAPGPEANNFGVYRFDRESLGWTQIDTGVPRDHPYTEAQAADFDGDGHVDVLLASAFGLVAIHRGDGTGGFTLAGKLPGVHGQLHRAAIGDIDGDGSIDVALLVGASKHIRDAGGLTAYLNGPEVWKEKGSSE